MKMPPAERKYEFLHNAPNLRFFARPETVHRLSRAHILLSAPSLSRRVRGKARTRLRYNQWVNSMDNWLSDEVPKLADYDKRQFPVQNLRCRKYCRGYMGTVSCMK